MYLVLFSPKFARLLAIQSATGEIIAAPRYQHSMTTLNNRVEKHMPNVDITVERSRAFTQAKRHGVLVRVLKFALPLLGVLIVVVAALSSKFSLLIGDGKVSVDSVKISTENLTMVNPQLDGFTDEGGKYSVTAAEAIQEVGNQEEIKLNEIKAHLTQASKEWAEITAPSGLFHVKREVLDLSGDINVTSSNGMKAFLTEANIFVKTHRIISLKPVRVEMLNGNVRSDRMTIQSQAKTVLFEGRVRVKILMREEGKKIQTVIEKVEN